MKIIWTTLALAAALNATGQEIRDMRCEYLENPLGIDTYSPRLGWRLDASQDGAGQTAFRVIVGTDSLRVAQGEGDTWDSKTHALLLESNRPGPDREKYRIACRPIRDGHDVRQQLARRLDQ